MKILKSRVKSLILYEMALGSTRPSQIARYLGKSDAAVVQQLAHLVDSNIITKLESRGRTQEYKINWDAVANRVLDRAPILTETLERITPRAHYFSETFRNEIKKIQPILSKNATFEKLVASYFKFIAKETKKDYFRAINTYGTIFDCIELFENSLSTIFPLIEKESIDDEAFLNALEAWYILTVHVEKYENKPMQEAFESLGVRIKSVWEK